VLRPPCVAVDRSQRLSLDELCSTERVLDDSLEERVRQTAVGYAMLVVGGLTDSALTGGFGGGLGGTDTHMLIGGRAGASDMLSTNGHMALAFRAQQMRTAVSSLRFSKRTLMHALPIESVFSPPTRRVNDMLLDDHGFPLDDMPELDELEELEMLERQSGLADDLWQPQLSDLDAF
jgi:hypothetical protein